VLYIILLEVASKLSRFCKMARRLKVVGPHCLTCREYLHRYVQVWIIAKR